MGGMTRPLAAAAVAAAVLAVAAAATAQITSPRIALGNLDSQIEALRQRASTQDQGACDLPIATRLELADKLSFRSRLNSRFSDAAAALAVVERAQRCAAGDARVELARAAVLTQFHRFDEAALALGAARAAGAVESETRGVEAAILHGRGEYRAALPLRRVDALIYPNIRTLGALAILLGDMGEIDKAEALFARARASYRDVSPIPLAWLDYSRGRVLRNADRPVEARAAFERARAVLPELLPNLGQLAEVHFEQGNRAFAIGLLRRLASESEDPDYAAHLARMLIAEGRAEEAEPWRERAEHGFAGLMKAAPEMYADHAAEFWMEAGDDRRRALRAAAINLANRRTTRAVELFEAALTAAADAPRPCRSAVGSPASLLQCRDELSTAL